jgi:hypothetical protein
VNDTESKLTDREKGVLADLLGKRTKFPT